jgi:hypothetical protein
VKLKLSLNIGLSGCTQEELIEIDGVEAADVAAMTEDEKQQWIDEYVQDFISNHVDAYGEIID